MKKRRNRRLSYARGQLDQIRISSDKVSSGKAHMYKGYDPVQEKKIAIIDELIQFRPMKENDMIYPKETRQMLTPAIRERR